MKNTPGPWKIKQGEQYTKIIYYSDGSTYHPIAQTLCPSCSGLQIEVVSNEADAHLISAAPDLLFACKEALQILECEPANEIYRAHKEIIRAAINKAEGREHNEN